jgi:hypothetical protein
VISVNRQRVGVPSGRDTLVVLTPDRPSVSLPLLDAIVYGRVFATRRAPASPLAGFDARAEAGPTWRIGMVHGALSIPGMTDGDEVVIDANEIATSRLDYLALGHWHSTFSLADSDSPEGKAPDITLQL